VFDRHASSLGAAVNYHTLTAQIPNVDVQPSPRWLVTAQIDGKPYTLHLDFGQTTSQLRDKSWAAAKLASREQVGSVVDETGTPRPIDRLGTAETVTLGPTTAHGIDFVPYGDKRWHDEDLEGALGLGFFHGFSVVVNWDREAIYVKPREGLAKSLTARLGRWQSSLMPKCAHPGCAVVSLIDPLASTPVEQRPPQHPGVIVSIVRDKEAANVALEVLIEVTTPPSTDANAPKNELQWLVANLPANTDRAMTHLPSGYAGAQLQIVDASPFPRACPAAGGCIDQLRPPPDAR
jgi:hypothetical protein